MAGDILLGVQSGSIGGSALAAKVSMEAMLQAERCLATCSVSRVNSIISIFFENLGNQDAAFPAIQGAEASWRELSGLGEEQTLRVEALRKVESLRSRAQRSKLPSAAAVDYALGAVWSLMVEWSADRPQYTKVAGESLAVALEFDRFGIYPPSGYVSWVNYELAGEAELAAQIFQSAGLLGKNEVFAIRLEAGSGSMSYAKAFKKWIRS